MSLTLGVGEAWCRLELKEEKLFQFANFSLKPADVLAASRGVKIKTIWSDFGWWSLVIWGRQAVKVMWNSYVD